MFDFCLQGKYTLFILTKCNLYTSKPFSFCFSPSLAIKGAISHKGRLGGEAPLAGSYIYPEALFPAVFGTSCLNARAMEQRSLRGFAPAGSASGASGVGSLDRDPRLLALKLKCGSPSELPIELKRMPDFAVYLWDISNTDKRIL